MSRGHGTATATVHAPHGPVTTGVRVYWVRCDGCGVGLAVATWPLDHGDDVCAELAADNGWAAEIGLDPRAVDLVAMPPA